MTTKSRLCLAAILVASLQFGFAQVGPYGPVNFYFDGPGTAVYDLTGDYEFHQSLPSAGGDLIDFSFAVSIAHDAAGRLTGSGVTIAQLGDVFVAANYTLTGRVSGGGGKATRALLSIRMSGADVVAGVFTPFSITVSLNLDVSANGLNGTGRATAAFQRLGRIVIPLNVSYPLPPGVNGAWSAQMDILPLNRLAGSGSLVLSNGRALPVNLSGSFSSRTGLSRVLLPGVSSGAGSSVSLSFLPNATTPQTMAGRILGQAVRFTNND